MFCKACGRNNPDGALSCIGCGAPLGQDTAGAPGMGMQGMGAPIQNPYPTAPNAYVPAGFAAPTSSKKLNIIGIIGAIIAFISVFLPYATVSFMGFSQSVSLHSAGGSDWLIVSGAALIGLVLSVIGNPVGPIVGGAVCIIVGFLENNSITEAMDAAGVDLSEYISKGAGCYMLFIGGAVMLVGGIYGIISKNK
ncbi:MAG: zinc ribbon domain-containing protein [Oscillospiraceae bacterium]|nr:zinc ribbon domain-containing protein [Oscillospiraceae bacterium]